MALNLPVSSVDDASIPDPYTPPDGTFNITGALAVSGDSSGGTLTATGLTIGSVVFAGTGGLLSQNNASLFWDNTNNRLGIGTAAPSAPFHLVQAVATSGSPNAVIVAGGAHTTLAASTEAIDVNVNLARTVQFATGALATQRAVVIQAPTYAFVGASTITTAATLEIDSAPVAGANATLTNRYVASFAANTDAMAIIGRMAISSTIATNFASWSHFARRDDTTGYACAQNSGGTTIINAAINQAINFRINGVDQWQIDSSGNLGTTATGAKLDVTQAAATSGTPTAFKVVGGAHTTLAASVEAIDVNLNLARTVQFATGALTTQRAMVVQAPTYAFVGASTLTTAATFAISAAPGAGTNATLTNSFGLQVGGAVNTGATSAGFIYRAINVPAHTLTVTGTTQVTSVGPAMLGLAQLTVTDASAVTIDTAATLYIAAAPVAAGSVTLTRTYSLWVDAGDTRVDAGLILTGAGTARAGEGVFQYNTTTNTLQLSNNNGAFATISTGSGSSITATNVTLTAVANAGIQLTGTSGFMEWTEISVPSNPAANSARLYLRDNGLASPNNRTQIVILWSDGTITVIAESPAA